MNPESATAPNSSGARPSLAEKKLELSEMDSAPARLDDEALEQFQATAYCLPGQTASGVAPRRGVIAADPRILPLGSVVHLRAGAYSGTYVVLDTGGRIRGHLIDIFMPDAREARRFGKRSVRLRVIGKTRPANLQTRPR